MNALETKSTQVLSHRKANQRYYAKKRDELVARMKERYSPEDAQAYYQENRETIRRKQNERYKIYMENLNKERIQVLKDIVEPTLHSFIDRLIQNADQFTANEITGVEKSLLIAGRKSDPLSNYHITSNA